MTTTTTKEETERGATSEVAKALVEALLDGRIAAIKLAYGALRAHDFGAWAARLEASAPDLGAEVASKARGLALIAHAAERFKRDILQTQEGLDLERVFSQSKESRAAEEAEAAERLAALLCHCHACTARREGQH